MLRSSRRIRFFAAALLVLAPAAAHDVYTTPITFSREVSRIIDKHCVSCHHGGGGAFSLATYAEARPWAVAIKEEVLARRMPPWGAVKGFGEFANDRGLTQEDLEVISKWVEGGAPEGDPTLLPKATKSTAAIPDPAATRELIVDGRATLDRAATFIGVRAHGIKADESVKVYAERPDGSIEPLIWFYAYNPKFAHSFWFKAPLTFPAGTRIVETPASAGTVGLFIR